MIFDNFEAWKAEAVRRGYKVREVTTSNYNTYWQALDGTTGIKGFFNTWVGPKGQHNTAKPGGSLQ